MTGTAQVVASTTKSSAFFRGIQPTPVGSPGAAARKILQSRAPSKPQDTRSSNNQHELLPDEAQGLKDLLLSTPSLQQRSRFSFLKLKRVVVPPVKIPPELDTPNAVSNIVAGSKIPMTKAMWMRRRAHDAARARPHRRASRVVERQRQLLSLLLFGWLRACKL